MLIKLSDLLKLDNIKDFKMHLAVFNGEECPFRVLLSDKNKWIGWNGYKSNSNWFNRKYILSFASVPDEKNIWIFGGGFEVLGLENSTQYQIKELDKFSEFIGRLKIKLKVSRNVRPNLETYFDKAEVSEILKTKPDSIPFKGYNNINLSFNDLEFIVKHDLPSWKTALSNMKGIYLLSDEKTGKFYIGSACGENFIWKRWNDYIKNGTGGNIGLINLSKIYGLDYIRHNFRFTLLEYFTDKIDDKFLLEEREPFWKRVFNSRQDEFGYNKN